MDPDSVGIELLTKPSMIFNIFLSLIFESSSMDILSTI